MNKDLMLAAFAVSIIALVSGALLTIVEKITEEPRIEIEKKKIEEGLRKVLPANVTIEQESPVAGKKIDELADEDKFFIYKTEDNREYKLKVWTAYKKTLITEKTNDKTPKIPIARAYLTGAQGYGGKIMLLLGVQYTQLSDYKSKKFELSGSIKNYEVQEMSNETPGLGSKIADEKFASQWHGLKLGKELNLKISGGNVDAITGATISSFAVNKAIRIAMQLDKQLRTADEVKYFDTAMKIGKASSENEAMRIKAKNLAIKQKADEERKKNEAENARLAIEKEAEEKNKAEKEAKKKADDDAKLKSEQEEERLKIQAEAEKIAAEIVAKANEQVIDANKKAKNATEKMNIALVDAKKAIELAEKEKSARIKTDENLAELNIKLDALINAQKELEKQYKELYVKYQTAAKERIELSSKLEVAEDCVEQLRKNLTDEKKDKEQSLHDKEEAYIKLMQEIKAAQDKLTALQNEQKKIKDENAALAKKLAAAEASVKELEDKIKKLSSSNEGN